MIKTFFYKFGLKFRWLMSFYRPQVIRRNVTEDGTVIPFPLRVRPGVYYRAYIDARYQLIGQVRSPRKNDEVLYRFLDISTGKEFQLTEGLKDLLFYRDHGKDSQKKEK